MINLIVAGGRDFDDDYLMSDVLGQFYNQHCDEDVTLISGGARGADKMAESFARSPFGWPIKQFIPDWDTLGKSAGYIRNQQMADNATHLIAFWDGKSKGTKHMIDIAKKKGLDVEVINY